MSETGAVLITLVTYKVVLVLIGLWASRRTQDNDDFFLGGRKLGAWVAALSASASSSSAWTLLGVSGAAYAWGLSAVWLFPATVGGFVLNWFWVAPRLWRLSRERRYLTLTEVIAGDEDSALRPVIIKTASLIIIFSFLFYVASQFQAAGGAFATTFGLSVRTSILIGAGIIVLYTLLGGFWAVSVTDTLQGLLMALTAVVLPAAALMEVGGFSELIQGLRAVGSSAEFNLLGAHGGFLAAAFVVGTLGIGLGYPGQPHVVNRFMALGSESALRRGRVIAVGWAVIVYSGMLLLGWCGRVFHAEIAAISDSEQIFFVATQKLFSPVIAGVMIASVLSAIMSTADSQLLVAGSSMAHDLRTRTAKVAHSLWLSRAAVLALSIVAVLISLYAPQAIFTRVLFAWHAVGSAFGPVLLLRLMGVHVRSGAVLAAICVGFGLTVYIHALPNAPGDYLERLAPFVAAGMTALAGRQRAS